MGPELARDFVDFRRHVVMNSSAGYDADCVSSPNWNHLEGN